MKKRASLLPVIIMLLGITALYLLNRFIHPTKVEPQTTALRSNDGLLKDTLMPLPELSVDTLPAPSLTVRSAVKKGVVLHALKIKSTIQEKIAVTRYEMTFFNPNKRDLEAELNFPLSEGQTITYFAMDVNGKMRPGVAVEKEKARVAFESTIRQNIDPGLVEMTKGNNFKARVFPVPSSGFKRIILEYSEEMHPRNELANYFVPLGFTDKVKQFDMIVEVNDPKANPKVIRSTSDDLTFSEVHHFFKAELHKKDFRPDQPLSIQITVPSENKRAVSADVENETYFHTLLHVPNRFREKESPSSISVFWDVSGSRSKESTTKELELLETYLSYFKGVSLEVVPFANAILPSRNFSTKGDFKQKVRNFLEQQTYDGGSSISCIPFEECKSEELLLFSDGLNNLGAAPEKIGNSRIYTITSAVSADQAALRSISDRSDAVFIDLTKVTVKEAMNRLKMDQLHFMGFQNDHHLMEYFPRKGTSINGSIGVSGKIGGSIKQLKALYGYGNKVVKKEVVHLKKTPSMKKVIKKLWAIKKLDHLYCDKKANKEMITALGIQERLVTSNTSLLVLDRVEDYVENEILPPTDLQKAYFAQLKNNQLRKKRERAQHVKDVYEDYRVQKDWWKGKKKFYSNKSNDLEVAFSLPSIQEEHPSEMAMERVEAPAENRSEGSDHVVASSGTYNVTVTNVNGATSSTFSWTNSTNLTVNSEEAPQGIIRVKGWDPKSPYMKRIKLASKKDIYSVYMLEKEAYGDQPSFYLDVAEYFLNEGKRTEAIRILTNIAELELENHSLLRILAHRLLQLEEKKVSIFLFKELIELRPEEPQSYRDLGLAYAEIGKNKEAVRLLYKVVTGDFDERFRGIQVIAINEINAILASTKDKIDTSYIDQRFLSRMPVDIRVVLNWDADNTDVDLWVTDPSGEKCFYSNNYTRMGGRISNDFTQGYGPEEFMLKNAKKGKYKVQAHYYGTSSQSLEGKATLTVQFFKQYGTKRQVKQEITRRLNVTNEVIDLGTFEF